MKHIGTEFDKLTKDEKRKNYTNLVYAIVLVIIGMIIDGNF